MYGKLWPMFASKYTIYCLLQYAKRNSRDDVTDTFGQLRLLLAMCCNLTVVNCRMAGDLLGQFTWPTYNGRYHEDYT